MAISKEVRIGLLAAVSMVVFFIGFYFLKGVDIFSNDYAYYCYYTNVDGLQTSANVQIKGLNVGHVSDMSLIPGKGVKVTIMVSKKVKLPQGTVANLQSLDLLGSKAIRLELGPGPADLLPHAELETLKEGSTLDNVSAELTPRLQQIKGTISSFDTTLNSVNAIVDEQNRRVLAAALISIKTTADNLATLSDALARESGDMGGAIHNINSITGNLAKSNDTIRAILNNASNLTRQLSNAPIQQTITSLQKTSNELHDVLSKVNNGNGSLGKLVNDPTLYKNLTHSLHTLDSLMADINAHPHRYINVNIIGGKKTD
jgi:phospholipid/cholesterol/gamma-HCH transport system substrate-binding protein